MKLVQYWISLALNSFSLFRFGHRKNFRMLSMLIFHKSIVTSIRYSAGLSRGPGPIRNCISSPWGVLKIQGRYGKVWKMTTADNQDDEQSTQATFFHPLQRRIDQHQWGWSRWSRIFETKMNTCCTCLTPLQTGHPSLLACHPNSYLNIHEEIRKVFHNDLKLCSSLWPTWTQALMSGHRSPLDYKWTKHRQPSSRDSRTSSKPSARLSNSTRSRGSRSPSIFNFQLRDSTRFIIDMLSFCFSLSPCGSLLPGRGTSWRSSSWPSSWRSPQCATSRWGTPWWGTASRWGSPRWSWSPSTPGWKRSC